MCRQFGIALRGAAIIGCILGALVVGINALHAQSPGNAPCAWGCVYTPPSQQDRYLRGIGALNEHALNNMKGNGGGGNTINNHYNAPVTNNSTYNGPVTNSGSTVLNVHNLNETMVTTTASEGSVVTVRTYTDQDAKGSQAGAANANAAAGNNATQSGSQSAGN